MHFNIYDVFYSQCSHQHVSAGILAILKVLLLKTEHENTVVITRVTSTP